MQKNNEYGTYKLAIGFTGGQAKTISQNVTFSRKKKLFFDTKN